MITTDVTSFGDELYCVAGWDVERRTMVRPEPPGTVASSGAARFWNSDYVGPGKVFQVGSPVTFEGNQAPAGFPYPHATEDVILRPESQIKSDRKVSLAETAALAAGSVSASVTQVYDGGARTTSSGLLYVASGHIGRSLGAMEIKGGVVFHEKRFPQKPTKLRVRLALGHQTYDLPVTSTAVSALWRAEGLDALQKKADRSNRIHIRLGLARPFAARPAECFAQVNGLYLL